MGRIKKYLTKEAKLASRNDASKKYYWNNKEITKGPYKGMEQWQKTAIKFTPGLRGVIESRDPKAKYQYFNTQIKK